MAKVTYNDMEIKTQDDFDIDHAKPVDYGDEGDFIVVGLQYSDAEAVKLINEHYAAQVGEGEQEWSVGDLEHMPMGIAKNEDGDWDYAVSFKHSDTIWQGKGVRTQ